MYENIELKQSVFPVGSRTFCIQSNEEIKVLTKTPFNSTDYIYKLERIDPNPVGFHLIDKKALVWFMLLFSLIILMVYSSGSVSEASMKLQLSFSAVLAPFCIHSLSKLIVSLRPGLAFRSIDNGKTAFIFHVNRPQKDEYERFIAELKKRIKSIRTPDNIPHGQKIANYLNHLEYLYREEVVLSDEYSTIKDRLIAKESGQVIKMVKE